MGSPSRRVTPNCLFPAGESRPSSRLAPPAEEGVSLQEYKIPSVQEGRPWQRKGTLSRRRVPLKRSDAPAKGERRPHSEKRGAPAKKEPHNKKMGATGRRGAPQQKRGVSSRRRAPQAEEGRPSRREAPQQKLIRNRQPPAEVGPAKQDMGAPLTISGRRQTPQQQMGAPGRRGAPHYKKKKSLFYLQEGRP